MAASGAHRRFFPRSQCVEGSHKGIASESQPNYRALDGAAITYGLVPQDKANQIMDRLVAKMKEVGYTHTEPRMATRACWWTATRHCWPFCRAELADGQALCLPLLDASQLENISLGQSLG